MDAFIPQSHAAGAEAEVDLGDVWIVLAGVKRHSTRSAGSQYGISGTTI